MCGPDFEEQLKSLHKDISPTLRYGLCHPHQLVHDFNLILLTFIFCFFYCNIPVKMGIFKGFYYYLNKFFVSLIL